jgi:hypothetical protein
MGSGGYELRLIEDSLASGGELALPADGINRVVYVVHGAVAIDGRDFGDDQAWQGRDAARMTTGSSGAALWRWELAPTANAAVLGAVPAAASSVKLRRGLAWPIAESLLMRCDSVAFPPNGCAYLHTHQGPGIRCLIDGGIRIDTEGASHCYAPGGAWFEAGPAPVFAQAADRPTRFIRVMVLPARLLGQSSIAYVNAEDRHKPKSQRYKVYVDAAIVL